MEYLDMTYSKHAIIRDIIILGSEQVKNSGTAASIENRLLLGAWRYNREWLLTVMLLLCPFHSEPAQVRDLEPQIEVVIDQLLISINLTNLKQSRKETDIG